MTEPVPRAHLLPSDATPAERAVAEVDGRLDDIDAGLIVAVLDPATCPAPLLPYLAWQRSVDVWDATWPEAVKRAVIAAAPLVHRLKGTRRSIEAVLGALGMRTQIVEWWQASPRAAPYTFEVTAFATLRYVRAGPLITRELTQAAITAVRASAPLSRAFEFRIGVEIERPAAAAVAGSAYGLTTPGVRARAFTRTSAPAAMAAAGSTYGLTAPRITARPVIDGIAGRITGTIAGGAILTTNVRGAASARTATGARAGAATAGRVTSLATPRLAARAFTRSTSSAATAAAGRAAIIITARMDAKL